MKYLLAHGVKEGLVARVEDWPGVQSASALLSGKPLEGYWFDRTKEYAARNRGEDFGVMRYAIREELVLSRLPCWEHLPPEQYRDRVAALIEQIEAEGKAGRESKGVQPLSPKQDKEVTRASLPRGEQGGPEELLGGLLRIRGRLPGGRREAQGGRSVGEIPRGIVPACHAVRASLPCSTSVAPSQSRPGSHMLMTCLLNH